MHQFHDQKVRVASHVRIVCVNDMRVVQPCKSLNFLTKPLRETHPFRQSAVKNFDCHNAAKLPLNSLVNRSHPSRADQFQ